MVSISNQKQTQQTTAHHPCEIESSQFMWLFIDEIVKILLIFLSLSLTLRLAHFSIMHQVEIIWAKLRAFPNIRQ